MQEWFEAGAADGFWISPDGYDDGIKDFVDRVVPILQERELFHRDHAGATCGIMLGLGPSTGRTSGSGNGWNAEASG